MSGGTGHETNSGDMLRKLAILVILVLAYIGLHRFAVPTADFDSRGLLALGFVVLAAYTVGELAEVVKLPHITGYLLAGLVLGPSTAHVIHDVLPQLYAQLPPPFDEGILNERVKSQLLLLDDLALALIALTAGGELKLESLRSGIRRILSVAGVQVAVLGVAVTGLIWAISGPIPMLALPQLEGVSSSGALALGAVVASISLATSPAATIAVINSSGAKGETTDTVLSVVVLKDVLVVICFSAATAVATGVLGMGAEEGGFLASLGHIAWSIVVGTVIGGLIHLYLRFVGAELLLFLVGLIYSATFLAHQWHLEAALVFITAGFVSANFSDLGDQLIHEVERLSLPVYVVFFTLAGAKLHLDVLWAMAGFALALVLVRMGALYASTRAGAIVGGGGLPLQQYGWMGFVSQAGLAITLANSMTTTYPGPIGEGLFSLVLGGVALNELTGPVMLQWGLDLSGDTGQARPEGEEEEAAPRPAPVALPDDLEDPWGEPIATGSPEVDESIADLESELKLLVKDLVEGPLARGEKDYTTYLGELRRDFLRGHRRATVATTSGEVDDLARVFHDEISLLGEAWRERVLDRAAIARAESWSPAELVGVLDALVAGMPESVTGPYAEASLAARPESAWMRLRRTLMRLQVRMGSGRREINVRALVRYHFSGRAPHHLEGVAALLINEECRLASRTSRLFAEVSRSWERAAELIESGEIESEELAERLGGMRQDLDEDFAAMEREVQGAYAEGGRRAAWVLGTLLRALKEDVVAIGTVDLPHRARRYGRVYAERNAGIRALTTDLAGARRTVAARMAGVALDLELVGLEGRIHAEVEDKAAHLERELRGRGPTQLDRVDQALTEWLEPIQKALEEGSCTPVELKALAVEPSEKLLHVVGDARRMAQELRMELTGDDAVAPVLRLMLDAARSLTDWYTIPSARVPEGDWSLPPEVPTVEVPFRDLTVAWVESRVARELSNRTWALADRAQAVVEFLAEVDRVIAFNVELAASELDLFESDAPIGSDQGAVVQEMLVGAVGRSQARLERLMAEIEPWPAEGGDAIRGAVVDALDALRGEVMDGGAGALRTRLFGERRVGQLLGTRGEWTEILVTGRQQLKGVALAALGPDRVESLRQFLGLPAEETYDHLRSQLLEPMSPVELPVVYRRLFSDRALEAGDLIVGRERELAAVQEALAPGAPLRSAALVGLRGTGATSLANAVARSWQGKVRRLVIDAPVTVEEVEGWFREDLGNTLTLLQGVRWVFTLEPGGLAPAQRLAALLADSRRGSPWLLTAEREAWRALSQLTDVDLAVGQVVSLDPLSEEDLASAVLARHQMSGYELVFDASEDVGWQVAHLLLRGLEGEARQREAWFRTLHEACDGVMHDALRLWLASIREVDVVNGVIRVGAVPRPPVSRLYALDDDTLMLLVQVMRQGWIDAALHARLFRTERTRSAVQLRAHCHVGLLSEREDGRFEVTEHLRTPIYRALRFRGWVQ